HEVRGGGQAQEPPQHRRTGPFAVQPFEPALRRRRGRGGGEALVAGSALPIPVAGHGTAELTALRGGQGADGLGQVEVWRVVRGGGQGPAALGRVGGWGGGPGADRVRPRGRRGGACVERGARRAAVLPTGQATDEQDLGGVFVQHLRKVLAAQEKAGVDPRFC